MAVSLVSSGFVRPAKLVFERTSFELTEFDGLMRYAPYQKRILFYDQVLKDSDYGNLVELLKRSLSEALVAFYPLAGRIRSGDGVSAPVLELDCSERVDLGVKFTEARTDMTLKELSGDYTFEPCDFCELLCDIGSPPPKLPWSDETPLVFIQVTKFRCGGLSVGVAFSHQAMDGVAAWDFITSWAEIARTGSLSSSKVPKVFYGFKKTELTKDQMIQHAVEAGIKMVDEDSQEDITPTRSFTEPAPVELQMKLFKLSRAAVNELKLEAGGAAAGGKQFSTYVVVCAHFWRKATAARGLTSISNFLVLVDCRGRIDSVPSSYFGNAISTVIATAPAGDLISKPLSYAASLLQQAIASFDGRKAEGVLQFMSWVLASPAERMKRMDIEPYTMVVSSPRHPVYKSDFGYGRPVGCTFGNNDLHHGKLYFFPSAAGDGGVEVTVVLNTPDYEKLLKLEC